MNGAPKVAPRCLPAPADLDAARAENRVLCDSLRSGQIRERILASFADFCASYTGGDVSRWKMDEDTRDDIDKASYCFELIFRPVDCAEGMPDDDWKALNAEFEAAGWRFWREVHPLSDDETDGTLIWYVLWRRPKRPRAPRGAGGG